MSSFVPGQRWISETEADLGLGTVTVIDFRTVTLVFLASGEARTYAKNNAPLSRVHFAAGDVVQSHEGWSLRVEAVREEAGLLRYSGVRLDNNAPQLLPEEQLSNHIQFSKPQERLFNGQIDPNERFNLRYQTLSHLSRFRRSPIYGLAGARAGLIPHQLYIAREVGSRYAPRVLLADEVGLGKTIEAGLILHQQLMLGRASRVLVVVPETLVHQWLVEMLRRFNLSFTLFNEEKWEAELGFGTVRGGNLFQQQQLVIASLEFLLEEPERQRQVVEAGWDLLVVDEAHHLEWSESSPSAGYTLVDALAGKTKGVLLLTATPEQLGRASHFARLRLLDPHRFHSYEAFVEEEELYEPVARAVDRLLEGNLPPAAANRLGEALGADSVPLLALVTDPAAAPDDKEAATRKLIAWLLDRHGTGRILFRNTRNAVQGFPRRELFPEPLPLPAEYAQMLAEGKVDLPMTLYPERALPEGSPWWSFDSRVQWLIAKLRALRPAKVLVICAHMRTALALEEALRRGGVRTTIFHEGLTILERDRAAAYFADDESGAQALVCSEIGSEGRNFQFAHHLVLFDLPANPDLLEQRIGRLDRIGQRHDIQIHIPYLLDSPQAVLFRWYHEGLNAFAQTCPAGPAVFESLRSLLFEALRHFSDREKTERLLATTRPLYEEVNLALQKGRDRLLELNSCRPEVAAEVKQQIARADRDPTLATYIERVFDTFGIDVEEHGAKSLVVRPGYHMLVPAFPELPEDGTVITFDRETALSHEDWQFLTWEHPMVAGAIDLVLSSEMGNTAVTTLEHESLPAGTLLLETIFVVECIAPRELDPGRFLPPTALRLLIDRNLRDHSAHLPWSMLAAAEPVENEVAVEVVKSQKGTIRKVLAAAEEFARKRIPVVRKESLERMEETLREEIGRLEALMAVNPNVREEELFFLLKQQRDLRHHIENAQLRLDALRVVVCT